VADDVDDHRDGHYPIAGQVALGGELEGSVQNRWRVFVRRRYRLETTSRGISHKG
jgi:hypothetical protein